MKSAIPEHKITGPATWLALPTEILSDIGKVIVSADPNLNDETISALVNSLTRDLKEVNFYFGVENPDDDVGLTLLSTCINDNRKATYAELIARYSRVAKTPFIETAIAVKNLQTLRGLCRYVSIPGGAYTRVSWAPKYIAIFAKPPAKRSCV